MKSICHSLVYEKGYISSVDVLMKLEYLNKKGYEDWRFGRVPYLERVCNTNLSKLTLINSLIKKFANELKLKGSITEYHKHSGKVKRKLQFSKSGDSKIEKLYSTHYLDLVRIDELRNNKVVNEVPL